MEAEKLLEGYVEKIHKTLSFKDKLKVYWCGITGDFKTIKGIIEFKPPKWDEKKAFIKICDNRIDRLKTSTAELAAVLGAVLIAVFLLPLSIDQIFQFGVYSFLFQSWFY